MAFKNLSDQSNRRIDEGGQLSQVWRYCFCVPMLTRPALPFAYDLAGRAIRLVEIVERDVVPDFVDLTPRLR